MPTDSAPVEVPVVDDGELELVTRAREGDSSAFSTLIRRYEGRIFRLAMNITQNREDAEDVLQESFLKAYEHLDQFLGNSKFYTWIVRIAVNQALMKLRKRRNDRSVSLDEQIDTGEDTVVREIAAWLQAVYECTRVLLRVARTAQADELRRLLFVKRYLPRQHRQTPQVRLEL